MAKMQNEMFNQQDMNERIGEYEKNKYLVSTHNEDSLIDLIFLLYKSFEIGEADKQIIKKNIAVLGFSVSKAMKEFRYDALREFNEKFKKIRQ